MNYHNWLTIEISNNYFQNGESSVFQIIPFENTSRQLKNLAILFNHKKNIISFYAGKEDQKPFDINVDLNGLKDMYFQLLNNDPLLFNYSDLPSINDQQILYFENRKNVAYFSQLQQSDFVSKDDIIAVKPKIFNIQLTDATKIIEIKSNNGASIIKEFFDTNQIENKFLVNLAQQEEGLYEVWINNKLQERFFCSIAMNAKCIGVIHFNIGELIANHEQGFNYNLNFNARSVYWRYLVIVPPSRKKEVNDMRVRGVSEEDYEGPTTQQLVGDQTALVFTSPAPVQLQSKIETNPVLQISYSNDFSNDINHLETKLPNPRAEELTINNQEGNADSFSVSTIVYV